MRLLLSSPRLGSGRIKSSSKGRRTRSSQGMQQNLKWSMVMIGLSILLALIGSVDVGHAFFKNGGAETSLHATSIHKNVPISKARHNPKISPTLTKSPVAAPTPTEIPVVTSTQPPALQPTVFPDSPNAKILVHDTFARANQVSWGSTSDGFAWQGDTTATNVFSVDRGEGIVANASGYYSAVTGPNVSQAMILVSGKIANDGKMDDGTQTSIGALLRWQDKNNWYKAYLDGTTLGIKRVNNGKTVILAELPFVAQPDTFYTIRFRAKNSTLSTRVWETDTSEPQQWMLTVNDNALSSGLGGVRLGIGKNTPVYVISFTEFGL